MSQSTTKLDSCHTTGAGHISSAGGHGTPSATKKHHATGREAVAAAKHYLLRWPVHSVVAAGRLCTLLRVLGRSRCMRRSRRRMPRMSALPRPPRRLLCGRELHLRLLVRCLRTRRCRQPCGVVGLLEGLEHDRRRAFHRDRAVEIVGAVLLGWRDGGGRQHFSIHESAPGYDSQGVGWDLAAPPTSTSTNRLVSL